MAGQAPRGRRQGRTNSRALIVASARRLFAEHGYSATSLREIARDAGVDPGMVHHYFAGKEDLFNACVELPVDPAEVLRAVGATPPQERGEALLRVLLTLWDSPAQSALLALLRGATGSKTQGALLRQVLLKRVLSRAMAGLPGEPAELALRGALVASQVMGLLVARYLLRMEPLAGSGHEQLVAWYAPTLQNYLTGPVAPVDSMGSAAHRATPPAAPTVELSEQ